MALSIRNIWAGAPPIVGATLDAAWVASKVGAVVLTAMVVIGNFAFGVYSVATGHTKVFELLGVIPDGAFMFLLSLLASLFITVPMSAMVALCTYPFLHKLLGTDRKIPGGIGFSIGALAWLCVWWNAPPGNLYFGSWISVVAIGGSAGCAGGLAFAERFRSRA